MRLLSKEQSEFYLCKAVTDIFHGASLEAVPLRHHTQIVTQRFIALFDVVSNFAAFKLCDRGIGNPPPSYPLPFHQLIYLAAQKIRLSHAGSPS
jgi:hypothetical protein